MWDLVDVELVAVVSQCGAVLPHQGAEGETKQLLLTLVLGCMNTGETQENINERRAPPVGTTHWSTTSSAQQCHVA